MWMMIMISAIGCSHRPTVNASLMGPYPESKVWAIAPLINESGTSAVNTLRLTDLLAQEAQQVQRIDIVPVTRVLLAMETLHLDRISTVHDAQAIIRLLELDGLIVGTVTAYDPYSPPVLGMSIELYTNGGEYGDQVASLNNGKGVRLLGASPSGHASGLLDESQPVTSVASVVDASNNAVLMDLQRFGEGRTDPDSAMNWKEYFYSIEAYSQYVGHRMLRDLVREERARLGRAMTQQRRADLQTASRNRWESSSGHRQRASTPPS